MGIEFGNNGPSKRLVNGVRNLESAFDQLMNAVGHKTRKNTTCLSPVHSFMIDLRDVRFCSERLLKDERKSGRIDAHWASQLNSTYRSLHRGLRLVGELQTSDSGSLSNHGRFTRVGVELGKLGENIRLILKAMDRQSEAEFEHDPLYENSRMLRQAIRKQDRELGEKVRLKDLDNWATKFDGIYWQDRKMVDRVANLFILAGYPYQAWELRRRSASPGRPYLYVMVTADLPSPELLELLRLPAGEYYIAARLPSWRIVWKMSWYFQI